MASASRAERRRQARAAHVATEPGQRDPQGHEWLAVIAYSLTREQARLMYEGGELVGAPEGEVVERFAGQTPPSDDPRVLLRASMIRLDASVGAVCWRCEMKWSPEIAARACPGDPIGYARDGKPMFRDP